MFANARNIFLAILFAATGALRAETTQTFWSVKISSNLVIGTGGTITGYTPATATSAATASNALNLGNLSAAGWSNAVSGVTNSIGVKANLSLLASFASFGDCQLYMSVGDGTNWSFLNGGQPVYTNFVLGHNVRDPSIMLNTDNVFYIVHTLGNAGPDFGTNKLAVLSSTNAFDWQFLGTFFPFGQNSNTVQVGAPDWYQEGGTNFVVWADWFWVGNVIASSNYTCQTFVSYATDSTMTNFAFLGAITHTGLPVNPCSPYIVRSGNTRYLFEEEQVGPGGFNLTGSTKILLATNSVNQSILGPYTVINTNVGNATTLFEAPFVIKTATGWRLCGTSATLRGYQMCDSTDLLNWGSVVWAVSPALEHGTAIPVPAFLSGLVGAGNMANLKQERFGSYFTADNQAATIFQPSSNTTFGLTSAGSNSYMRDYRVSRNGQAWYHAVGKTRILDVSNLASPIWLWGAAATFADANPEESATEWLRLSSSGLTLSTGNFTGNASGLTNFPAALTNGYVTSSITNGLATTSITNGIGTSASYTTNITDGANTFQIKLPFPNNGVRLQFNIAQVNASYSGINFQPDKPGYTNAVCANLYYQVYPSHNPSQTSATSVTNYLVGYTYPVATYSNAESYIVVNLPPAFGTKMHKVVQWNDTHAKTAGTTTGMEQLNGCAWCDYATDIAWTNLTFWLDNGGIATNSSKVVITPL
jgi:sucrose-6-phosphate hydrolase SacC (GH32 family)